MSALVFKFFQSSKNILYLFLYTASLLVTSLGAPFTKTNMFQHPYVLIIFYLLFVVFISSSTTQKQYVFQRLCNSSAVFFYYLKQLHIKLVEYFSSIILVNVLFSLFFSTNFTLIGFFFYVFCGYLALLTIIIFFSLSYSKTMIRFPSIVIGSIILLLFTLNFASSFFVSINIWFFAMYSEKFVSISATLFINMFFGYSLFAFLLYLMSQFKQKDNLI